MSNENSQEQLLQLAMKELNKVLQDVKQGRTATMSSTVQKLSEEFEKVGPQANKMTEEEAKAFAERLVKEISKLEE